MFKYVSMFKYVYIFTNYVSNCTIYTNYAHLASVRFKHSVCGGSLMITYIYIYIYTWPT